MAREERRGWGYTPPRPHRQPRLPSPDTAHSRHAEAAGRLTNRVNDPALEAPRRPRASRAAGTAERALGSPAARPATRGAGRTPGRRHAQAGSREGCWERAGRPSWGTIGVALLTADGLSVPGAPPHTHTPHPRADGRGGGRGTEARGLARAALRPSPGPGRLQTPGCCVAGGAQEPCLRAAPKRAQHLLSQASRTRTLTTEPPQKQGRTRGRETDGAPRLCPPLPVQAGARLCPGLERPRGRPTAISAVRSEPNTSHSKRVGSPGPHTLPTPTPQGPRGPSPLPAGRGLR